MLPTSTRLIRRSLGASFVLAFALGLPTITCGGRTELDVPPPLPPEPECDFDEDCPDFDNLCAPVRCVDPETFEGELPEPPAGYTLPPRVCVIVDPVDCDDNDPCTEDVCEPMTGICSYGPSTFDLDGDGHNAPLPGRVPGTPGSCGDDCNDASELAFPGNTEVCDGVDNDCNGVVDDDATFQPLNEQPIRLSSDGVSPAGAGGIAYNGETYLSVYTGTSDGFDMYQTRLMPDGTPIEPQEEKFTFQNADSAGGPVVWIGDRYGIAWEDRRDGNYEAYFALLGPEGDKVIADTRLSFAPGFSVNPDLAWTGSEFIAVWQDDRDGVFQVLGQRVSIDGNPIGSNIELSNPGGFDDEAPEVAAGDTTVGVVYANGQAGIQVIRFRAFDLTTFQPVSDIIDVTDGASEAVYPDVTWNDDRFIVSWYDRSGPLRAIFAATLSATGQLLTPPTPISSPGANHSRYPTVLPLGDRSLFIYSDDRNGNMGYELFSRMVDRDLVPITDEMRLTDAPFDSIRPHATFGPDGNVGILFRDDRLNGEHHVWFTRLGCVVP